MGSHECFLGLEVSNVFYNYGRVLGQEIVDVKFMLALVKP
jgi:hypothetical protein